MRVRIVTDEKTPWGRVEDAETGELVRGVVGVELRLAHGKAPVAIVEFKTHMDVDVEVDTVGRHVSSRRMD